MQSTAGHRMKGSQKKSIMLQLGRIEDWNV